MWFIHRGVIRSNRHYFGISSKWEQMYLQGTGQTAPYLKEPSAENQTKSADDSFRDELVSFEDKSANVINSIFSQ